MSEMFFGNEKDGGITLEEIYSNIFKFEEEQSNDLAKDVMIKFMKSKRRFSEVEDEQEREYLQVFSFIAMLSFDVYLKKNLIESTIDEILAKYENDGSEDKSDDQNDK
jgi:hypothetical protein